MAITSSVPDITVSAVEDQTDDVETVYDLTFHPEVNENATLEDGSDDVAHWSRAREIPLMNGGVFFKTIGTVDKCQRYVC